MGKPILKKLQKTCAVCGAKIKVTLYEDRTYHGGHYFGNILANNKYVEYWECPKCYW